MEPHVELSPAGRPNVDNQDDAGEFSCRILAQICRIFHPSSSSQEPETCKIEGLVSVFFSCSLFDAQIPLRKLTTVQSRRSG
jgi:hypothetical protein